MNNLIQLRPHVPDTGLSVCVCARVWFGSETFRLEDVAINFAAGLAADQQNTYKKYYYSLYFLLSPLSDTPYFFFFTSTKNKPYYNIVEQ